MNKRLGFLLLFPSVVFLLAADLPKLPPMPIALTSNAVLSVKNGTEVYSMMGIGAKRSWDDITSKIYVLSLKSGKWTEGRPVPGVAGRLSSSAVGARGQIFLFGGYTVDGQGSELVVGDVNSYFVASHRWYRAEDIPIPVEGAVIGVNHDRYIYLVGGRSRNGAVNNVQVYDAGKNTWSQATPFPGSPVFGHAGGLVDDAIVFVDGAKKSADGGAYVVSDQCWIGKIDHKDPNKIDWGKLPAHPGQGRFGIIAAGGEHRVYFSGGATAPHNYKGVTADGKPIDISPVTFTFDVHGNRWETLSEDTPDARADSRGIAFTPLGPLIVGGTLPDSNPSANVLALPKK